MILTKLYKVLGKVFGRVFWIVLSVLLQVAWTVLFILALGGRYTYFTGLVRTIAFILVLYIVNRQENPSYKLAWIVWVLFLPVLGIAIYGLFGSSRTTYHVRKKYARIEEASRPAMRGQGELVLQQLEKENALICRQSRYIQETAGYPVYTGTKTEYCAEGEQLFAYMVENLRKAERFVFMEYFIIDDGEMWGTILDILEEKAKAGLDVRLIYDDAGCVNTLPAKFYKKIRERGIRCEVFNPFRPVISGVMNNRNHRKIMVVDGRVGFTGGINLADEYINKKQRFGHWKDTGIMIEGPAVWNFTVMFLQMWAYITGETITKELLESYKMPELNETEAPGREQKPGQETKQETTQEPSEYGYVQPYSDTPLDHETVGENVYLNIITQAEKYIYIFTPYLIIDNEMMSALTLAAKSGVDVRIVTPGIPDKRLIYLLSHSYYRHLVENGVHIYEYQPGFLHAKCFVCDDKVATVGTINLDYRSLYLHFECGIWMYRTSAVAQVKEDVMQTLEKSREITLKECTGNLTTRIQQSILRLFAPML